MQLPVELASVQLVVEDKSVRLAVQLASVQLVVEDKSV